MSTIKMSPLILALILALCATLSPLYLKSAKATGVFELELIDLQPFGHSLESNTNFRVLVCLKEAFTSKLDGQCTFGNASVTLNKLPPHKRAETANLTEQQLQQQVATFTTNQQQHLPSGSLSTNLVRILFTFRWTVSKLLHHFSQRARVEGQMEAG